MSGITPLTPPLSPLAQFEAGLTHGGITIAPEAPPARRFPPRLGAGSDTQHALATTGTVYSATHVSTRAGSHMLALIDLTDGGRLLARLRGETDASAAIGAQVALATDRQDDEPALTFTRIAEGAR